MADRLQILHMAVTVCVQQRLALKLADIVVTEAGFGADLGAEKFLDIKCRKAGLKPDAVVLVATVRALKYNGGVPKENLSDENLEALKKGIVNLEKHIENLQKYRCSGSRNTEFLCYRYRGRSCIYRELLQGAWL